MKRLQIRVLGSKHPPYKLQLQPGTKASDILAHLKLFSDSWVLAPASDPTTFFHSDEDLYATVEDQAKLIALIDTTEADNFMEYIAFGEGPL